MRENKLVSLHYASYLPSIWTDPKDTSFLWHRPQQSTFLALSSFSYLWDTHWRCHFTLLPQEEWFTREKPRRNVYKFAATCDYEDSIRWDVACSVDLWVSNAARPPLRVSCNLVHYDLWPIDFPWRRKLLLRLKFARSVPFPCGERSDEVHEGTMSKVTRGGVKIRDF